MVAPEVRVRLHMGVGVLVERLQLEPQIFSQLHPGRGKGRHGASSPHWLWDEPRDFFSGEAERKGFWAGRHWTQVGRGTPW